MNSPLDTTILKSHSSWFIAVLIVLLFAITVAGSNFAIQTAKQEEMAQAHATLKSKTEASLKEFLLWEKAIHKNILRIANSSIFQIFADEVQALGDDVPAMLKLATTGNSFTVPQDNISKLASQHVLMTNLLGDFVHQYGALSAQLVTLSGQVYLQAGKVAKRPFSNIRPDIQEKLRRGESILFPFRLEQGSYVLDMVQPVFAPLFDGVTPLPVGMLVVSLPFPQNWNTLNGAPSTDEHNFLIQQQDENYFIIHPTNKSNDSIVPAKGWRSKNGIFEAEVRPLPFTQTASITLALPLSQSPFYIGKSISVSAAEQNFSARQTKIIVYATCTFGFGVLLILSFWWRLTGKRERLMTQKLKMLFAKVTEQKNLLDNINSTISEGIALFSADGVLSYANAAFANHLGRTPQELVTLNTGALFGYDTGLRIQNQMQHALSTQSALSVQEEIWLQSKKHYFTIHYSPFIGEEMHEQAGIVAVFHDETALVKARQRNDATIEQTISVLVNTVESIDPYLCGQATFTEQIALALCRGQNLDKNTEDTLRTASRLYQIGMLRLPSALLRKKGALTPEERKQMEEHIQYTTASLQNIDFGMPVLETIQQMYERLDGTGYPNHLMGDKIMLTARILGLANSFCALLRPRSYRTGKTAEEALTLLANASPAQYDPALIDALKVFLKSPKGEDFLQKIQKED